MTEAMPELEPPVQRVLAAGLVDTVDVARMLETTQRSVQRWHAQAAAPRKDAQDRLLELASVLDLAKRIMPAEGARLWLRTPIEALGWYKPLDAVKRGQYHDVIDALLALSEGVIQ
jgi:putative toxin-antitoxin system antitoxin component (TIGR02293 family)